MGKGKPCPSVLLRRTNGNAPPHIDHAQASRRASSLQQPQRLGHQGRQRRLSIPASQQPTAPGHPCGASGQSLTPNPHQRQPTRATPNALWLLSRLPHQRHAGCQGRQTINPLNPSQTMIHRYEKQIHDACMALFVVGMIGTAWHVALAELAKQPTQHSGTQVHKVVAR